MKRNRGRSQPHDTECSNHGPSRESRSSQQMTQGSSVSQQGSAEAVRNTADSYASKNGSIVVSHLQRALQTLNMTTLTVLDWVGHSEHDGVLWSKQVTGVFPDVRAKHKSKRQTRMRDAHMGKLLVRVVWPAF